MTQIPSALKKTFQLSSKKQSVFFQWMVWDLYFGGKLNSGGQLHILFFSDGAKGRSREQIISEKQY